MSLTQKYQKVKADFCFLEIYAFSHSRTVQTASLYGRLPAPTAEKARFATETKIGRFGRQISWDIVQTEQALKHHHYCLLPVK